jgi:hypothetical protein
MENNMSLNPLNVNSDFTISRQPALGKPMEKIKIEDVSEKELLVRLASLSQSMRTMMLFFVWIAILEIIGGIVILGNLAR